MEKERAVMTTRWIRALCATTVALQLTSCDNSRRASERQPQLFEGVDGEASRSFISVGWDTIWSYGGVDDTVLQHPAEPRVLNDTLYVIDRVAQRVVAVDGNGRLAMVVGGVGRGPGEFRNVRDLQLSPDGRVYLNDPDNGRIAVLSTNGTVIQHIPTGAVPHAESMALLSNGHIALITVADSLPIRVVDHAGNVVGAFDMPWPPFATLSIISKQGRTAVSGDRWAYLFSQGNGWFAFADTTSVVSAGRYVEHADFPKVVVTGTSRSMLAPRPCTACSATVINDTLYVHFGGQGPDALSVVDVYSVDLGKYSYSFRLPFKADAVAVGAMGAVYAVVQDPYPRIIALRPQKGMASRP
jgi:hypothetical protein